MMPNQCISGPVDTNANTLWVILQPRAYIELESVWPDQHQGWNQHVDQNLFTCVTTGVSVTVGTLTRRSNSSAGFRIAAVLSQRYQRDTRSASELIFTAIDVPLRTASSDESEENVRQLVIVGYAGFGREPYALIQALQRAGADWQDLGFVTDAPADADIVRVHRLGCRVLATVNDLAKYADCFDAVVAIGSGLACMEITERLSTSLVSWAILVHPESTLRADVEVGEGSIVFAGARLSTGITVGRYVYIDQNVTARHDAPLGDFSRINTQGSISGSVTIEISALQGAGASILQKREVGAFAVVGAGPVVVRDVPRGSIVKRVPAR